MTQEEHELHRGYPSGAGRGQQGAARRERLDSRVDGGLPIDADILWQYFVEHGQEVIEAAYRPRTAIPVSDGEAYFAALVERLGALFGAAAKLVRRGRADPVKQERDSAERLDQRLQDLCYSLMDDWFADWMAARTVFLVNFRELLANHEGQYVLIGRDATTGDWDVLDIKASQPDAERAAKERGLEARHVLIQRIVKGAEKMPTLDLDRPEDVQVRPSNGGSGSPVKGDER